MPGLKLHVKDIYKLQKPVLAYINKNNKLKVGIGYATKKTARENLRPSWLRRQGANQQGDSMMRRSLVLAMACSVFGMLAAPSAFARLIVMEPPPPEPASALLANDPMCTDYEPCNVRILNETYEDTFVQCSQIPADTLAANPPFTGDDWCLWLNQVTGSAANTFSFVLTVPAGEGGQSLDCSGSPPTTQFQISCPSTMPADDTFFTVTFRLTPALATDTDFYLLTDFPILPDNAFVTASFSVPEPGGLGLFGLGLLAIGVGYGWERRRQSRRANAGA